MPKWVLLLLALAASPALAATPAPLPVVEGDYVLKDFRFANGESLPALRMHYRTLGKPVRDTKGQVRNAVLIGHGTGGQGGGFIRPEFSGMLFVPGGLLDITKYYIVMPDGIGHGKSSKPSDGMAGKFPHYRYNDMVEAVYRLLNDGLHVDHLRLVMGTSMGGMQSWLWAEQHPDFMDAAMPLASLPTQVAGRNRVWRRVAIDAIRNDPAWMNGSYKAPPFGLTTAEQMLFLIGENPVIRQRDMPTLAKADEFLDASIANSLKTADANDILYNLEASEDYDPGPNLEKIRVPLYAVNSADDLVNPPELGILEREIKRVPKGKAVVIPLSPETRGHGSHSIAVLWKQYLAELLATSERK